jgi:cleavage and polyadenylation specificity factor subunit 1
VENRFVPGASPALILKHAASNIRIHNIQGKTIKALNSYRSLTCARDFIYVDDQDLLHIAQLPADTEFGHSEWVSQKRELGAFFERTGSYVLATSKLADFQLPQDDEWNSDWQDEKISFPPQVEEGSIRLFSPLGWKVISNYALEPAERAMCVKCMNLEISETHDHKDLIVVGTAVVKGENVTSRGNIYIFDVVDVVSCAGNRSEA